MKSRGVLRIGIVWVLISACGCASSGQLEDLRREVQAKQDTLAVKVDALANSIGQVQAGLGKLRLEAMSSNEKTARDVEMLKKQVGEMSKRVAEIRLLMMREHRLH